MQLMLLTSRTLFIGGLLILLAACASKPTGPEASTDPDVLRAEKLIAQQDYLGAAVLYRNLAARNKALATKYLLLAADANQRGGDIQSAENLLQQLSTHSLDANQQLYYQLLQAEVALSQKRHQQALDYLLTKPLQAQHQQELKKRYYQILAQAYRQLGELVQSAQSLQALDKLLKDPQQRLQVQGDILRNLTALNELALSQIQPTSSSIASGWIQLALLIKQQGSDPTFLQQAYPAWQQRFPGHPALTEAVAQYVQQLDFQVQQATRIAVLLPQTGVYASAAQAIRDGLLISLYRMPAEQRPHLQFYDSSDNHALWPLYNQAINDGADFVIGPIQKAAVGQLARAGQLRLPVLALNQVSVDSVPAENFYMFGLSPEDEARQAAERIWLDGLRHPVALVPEDPWGDRLFNVFRERWLTLSGSDVDVRRFNPKGHDHSAAITSLLHLDQSQARHKTLQRWLGRRLEFEPRRRTDVDSVFLVSRSQQVRSFPPQLKFHRGAGLPLYTTSHVWTGRLNRQQLADMRHMMLPDIPMLVLNDTRDILARNIPEITSPLSRLYALGMDALTLVPHLKRLQNDPYASMDGETGNLYMDNEKRIHRQLVWLKLDEPVKILGYASRLDLPGTQETALPANEAPR